MRYAFLVSSLILLTLAACAQTDSPLISSPASSSSQSLASPILTEAQAIETASQKAALDGPGLTGVSDIRNQQARLMTMGEYWALGQYDQEVFGRAKWYPESGLPVWVVLMEGNSESTLPASSPLTPKSYDYFVVVLNAHTGYKIGASPLPAPDQLLAEAQGLDPALYARYPLEAALKYAKRVTDFPISEPSYLPVGFSLARVTLELAHPLQNVLPYPRERRRTVLQNYADVQGSTIQLAQFRGGLPDLIEDADRTTVQKTKAWASHKDGESTWLMWSWVFPEAGAYVTNVLYSEARSIPLSTLYRIAASMPAGRPPIPPPEPVKVPTALPGPTPTSPPPIKPSVPECKRAPDDQVQAGQRATQPAALKVESPTSQDEYTSGQLFRWRKEAEAAVYQVAGVWSSWIDEERNRIMFTVYTDYVAEKAREALAETGVPVDAAAFDVDPKKQLDDPPVSLDSPIEISISLEFQRNVPVGQPVLIEVVLTNKGDAADGVEHGTPYFDDVMVFTFDGDEVWTKLRGMQVGVGGSTRLEPGEQIRLETVWEQRDQDGFISRVLLRPRQDAYSGCAPRHFRCDGPGYRALRTGHTAVDYARRIPERPDCLGRGSGA